MEGAGVYFKASLCGKIYKHLSFLVEEDIRPRDDFKEAEWFLTTVEVNYKFNKYLLAGSGYMSLARYKASDELRNRYYLYATGTYSAGRFTLSVRERFQSTYKVHAEHPKNYLRSMLTLSYKIGKSGFCPFAYTEVFNDTRNKMRSDKIRFSTGSNYQLNPNKPKSLISYLPLTKKLKWWHSKLNKPKLGKKACCSRCLFNEKVIATFPIKNSHISISPS